MFTTTITPRFGDVDVLGHVNNTVPAYWFELARTKTVMRLIDPKLQLTKDTFPLILAHTDYDFVSQVYIQPDVEIKTWISKIGTKSFTVYHECWQESVSGEPRLCIKGTAVIVYYDFIRQQSIPIPEDKRKVLEEHLLEK